MTPLTDFSPSSRIVSAEVDANFALCVLTDTARTITVSHTWSVAQLFADGTVGAPGITFSADTDSGLYRIGANNVGVVVSGAKVLDVGTAGLGVTGTFSSSGAATLSSTLAVTGAATFASTIRLPNNTYLLGRNSLNSADLNIVKLNASDQVEMDRALVVSAVGVTASLSVGTTLAVTGAATMASTLSVAGVLTHGGTITSASSHVNNAVQHIFRDVPGTAEWARITTSGVLVVGHSAGLNVATGSPLVQGHSTSGNNALFGAWSNDAVGAYLTLSKSRGAIGAYTAVSTNDVIGRIDFTGADGSDVNTVGARIMATVAGANAANRMPGYLSFHTAPGASDDDLTERLRITSGGIVLIGTTVTTGAAAGELVLANAKPLRAVNAAGTGTIKLVEAATLSATDVVRIGGSANTYVAIGDPAVIGWNPGSVTIKNAAALVSVNAAGNNILHLIGAEADDDIVVGSSASRLMLQLGSQELALLNPSTRTTIGANGAASALTANPLGYFDVDIGGTNVQIPYYNRGA